MERAGEFRRNPETTVITPHEGEAAYMLGAFGDEVSANRLSSCVELAKKFGVARLKGPHTLICAYTENPDQKQDCTVSSYSNFRPLSSICEKRAILEGGPQLAIPGSGDVLAGVIGAFLAAGMPPMDAATLGALTHAAAGGLHKGANGLLASELARYIPLS
jgi:NAD(P)H-hydrate epimerase